MKPTVNVLVSTFSGLSLPQTLCLPLPSSLSHQDLLTLLANLLPPNAVPHIRVTTSDNKAITSTSASTLADLISSPQPQSQPSLSSQWTTTPTPHLTLRLSAPQVGGKGGFGSQLRAAGGRMSSRKRKQNAELATGSARNLDGRRLRTVTEAKNLATYLATKPEMDRREKEERKKRWTQVIELAERREADMRAGKTVDGRRVGLSEEWIQEKEDVGDNVKNAVKLALAAEMEAEAEAEAGGRVDDSRQKSRGSGGGSGSDESPSDSADEHSGDENDPMELDEEDMSRLRKEAEAGDADAIWVLRNKLKIPASYLPKPTNATRRFAGFDDDLSSSDSDDPDDKPESETVGKGKSAVRD